MKWYVTKMHYNKILHEMEAVSHSQCLESMEEALDLLKGLLSLDLIDEDGYLIERVPEEDEEL